MAVQRMYRLNRLAIPHALNPDVYVSQTTDKRGADIGLVGDLYERLIGDRERTDIVKFFERHGGKFGLHCDIRYDRLRRPDWVAFLMSVRRDRRRIRDTLSRSRRANPVAAKTYLKRYPKASFEEVFDRCFESGTDYRSGKAISSRHFEPIGTETCQILIEGRYIDIPKPGVHYISVKANLSDVSEAVRQFKDQSFRRAMVETTLRVLPSRTYLCPPGHSAIKKYTGGG